VEETTIPALDNNTVEPVHKQWIVAGLLRRIPPKIILLLVVVFLIGLFFILPAHAKWGKEKLVGYWNDFVVQRKELSPEQRMIKRFGTEYTYSKEIADFFEKRGNKNNVLVLIPTQAYFKKYGMLYEVPEPVTFYYFTALKTVWPKNKNAGKANWYVTVKDKKLQIDSVTGNRALEDTITVYKNF